MASSPLVHDQGLRPYSWTRLIAALLTCAMWMMPIIITAPGMFEWCEKHDIQAPSPISEEEEEVKHSKLPPVRDMARGHAATKERSRIAPVSSAGPASALLEVPYPPPRGLAC